MSDRLSTVARRGLLLAWLLAVWVMLWGEVLPVVLLSGVVVATVAVWASRLPQVPLMARVSWRRVPGLVLRFAIDVVRSSWQVAVATVRSGPRTRASVVALQIPPGVSDAGLLLACNRISLEPGSIVVDVDLQHARLFVYQLDTPDRDAVERARRRAQAVLEHVAATFPARERGGEG